MGKNRKKKVGTHNNVAYCGFAAAFNIAFLLLMKWGLIFISALLFCWTHFGNSGLIIIITV